MCEVSHTPLIFVSRWELLAPRPGFEPGLEDSKSSVLPLDDLGLNLDSRIYSSLIDQVNGFGEGVSALVGCYGFVVV